MSITIACSCGSQYTIEDAEAGTQAKCPYCGLPVTIRARGPGEAPGTPRVEATSVPNTDVPPPRPLYSSIHPATSSPVKAPNSRPLQPGDPLTQMAQAGRPCLWPRQDARRNAMHIDAKCSCGLAYKVSQEFAGREVKCRACGEVFRLPGLPDADSGSTQTIQDSVARQPPVAFEGAERPLSLRVAKAMGTDSTRKWTHGGTLGERLRLCPNCLQEYPQGAYRCPPSGPAG